MGAVKNAKKGSSNAEQSVSQEGADFSQLHVLTEKVAMLNEKRASRCNVTENGRVRKNCDA